MMAGLFWLAAAFFIYVYLGYPALLWIWARVRPRNGMASRTGEAPAVTIIIAARNEGRRLKARLENLLQLDYGAPRQIVVVSDGSTDDTEAVVASFDGAVDLVSTPLRGKAMALNAGVERARFDVLVFTDARQLFANDALDELTAPLEDPQVGAVTGELVLDCETSWRRTAAHDRRVHTRARTTDRRNHRMSATVAAGIGAYWRYEKALRRLESTVGSTLGATGAIYAMRRSLWQPLPPDTILDDVLAPMRVVLAGQRVIFNARARAFDSTADDTDTELTRKVRTLAGNYQILGIEPRLLAFWANPVWLQYASHKIGRLLVPYALLTMFGTSLILAASDRFYLAALIAQCAFYVLAGYGAWLDFQSATGTSVPVARAKEPVNA